MSLMMMVRAMDTKVGNPTRKLVLLKLADNANDQGICWPSYEEIAEKAECSRRSAIEHIKALEDQGLLVIQRRAGPKGNSSNYYHLFKSKQEQGGEKSAPPKRKKKAASGGANSALGGSADSAPPGEIPAPYGEPVAPGGGEISAPGTSHSFEPTIEPVSDVVGSESEPDNREGLTRLTPPTTTKPPVDLFSKPLISAERLRWPLPVDWKPSIDSLNAQLRLMGIDLFSVAEDPGSAIETATGEFIAYWLTRPEVQRSQHQWENTLAKSIKNQIEKARAQQARQPARPATLADNNDVSWADDMGDML